MPEPTVPIAITALGDEPLTGIANPLLPIDVAAVVQDVNSMSPSILKPECKIKAGKRVDDLRNKPGDSTLAKDIKSAAEWVRHQTDCQNLQDSLRTLIIGTQDDLDNLKKDIQKKLEDLFPLLSVPLNPFKLPAYIVKQTIGRIMPDIKALIDLLKRTVQVLQALIELIQVAEEVLPRLKQCALDTIEDIEDFAKDTIKGQINRLEKQITDSIAQSICEALNEEGVTLDDIATVMDGINTVSTLISTAKELKSTTESAIDSTISLIGSHQSTVQELTGIPPVLDTSSQQAFFQTLDSPEYAQWADQVNSLVQLPPPVISVSPQVTGNAVVGSTLTSSNGTWTANGVVSNSFNLSWQWYRENQPIDGANTYTYTPTMADVEYPLYCMVTAGNQTNIEQAESNKTALVQVGSNSSTIPVITGTAASGQLLTCSSGSWPFTPTTIQYEWVRYVSPSIANTIVQSLSGNNIYKCTSSDVGAYIYCKVVASSFRYTVPQLSATTAQVS